MIITKKETNHNQYRLSREIVEHVANEVGLPVNTTKLVLLEFIELLKVNLTEEGKSVNVYGLATFTNKRTVERTGINPFTGNQEVFPSRIVPVIKISNGVKNRAKKN